MITKDQYELLLSVRDKQIELKYPLPKEWNDLKEYIYCVRTYELRCSNGTKQIPWIWSANVYGLDALEQYEKAEQRKAKKHAKKERSQSAWKWVKALIIPGIIVGIILWLWELFFNRISP